MGTKRSYDLDSSDPNIARSPKQARSAKSEEQIQPMWTPKTNVDEDPDISEETRYIPTSHQPLNGRNEQLDSSNPDVRPGDKASTPIQPSIPSRAGPPQNATASHVPTADQRPNVPDIPHIVVEYRASGDVQLPWSGRKLSEGTLETFFSDVTAHTPGREVCRILFNLSST